MIPFIVWLKDGGAWVLVGFVWGGALVWSNIREGRERRRHPCPHCSGSGVERKEAS